MKKYILYISILIVLAGLFSPVVKLSAQTNTGYQLLAPLPCPPNTPNCAGTGKFENFDPTSDASGKNPRLGEYLNLTIKLIIGISAVLAVVMIVICGIEYMTSELISSKEAGRQRMTNAVLGLLIALGAYALLFTINPDLLNTDIKIPGATITVTLDEQIKIYAGQGKCEPINSASSACSPLSLAAAGFLPEPSRATEASSICNGESGGSPQKASEVDVCGDNNPFSFGLFQINIIAHENAIPGGVCSGIFQVNGGGTQGACLPGYSKNGICFKRDCRVINQATYQTCKNYIIQPANNIKFAIGLQASRGWSQWGAYNSCRGKF